MVWSPAMHTQAQFEVLQSLREKFLKPSPGVDYWTPENLALYDETFAQRIRWKWWSVLSQAKDFSSTLPIVDWGCGTGIASRAFLDFFEVDVPVYLSDRSQIARDFAVQKLGKPPLEDIPDKFTLLVSHVLGELQSVERMLALADHAENIFWVEPGTYDISRKLVSIRERLKKDFKILAPCTHQQSCPLLEDKNKKHWCHQFAAPPKEVFREAHWQRFGKNLGIDLRSLPMSYLILTKKDNSSDKKRIIGRGRITKGKWEGWVCSKQGIERHQILKRSNPPLYKELKNNQDRLF